MSHDPYAPVESDAVDRAAGTPRLLFTPTGRGELGYVDPLLSILAGQVQLAANQSAARPSEVVVRPAQGGTYQQAVQSVDVTVVPPMVVHGLNDSLASLRRVGVDSMTVCGDETPDPISGLQHAATDRVDVTCKACQVVLAGQEG